MTHDNQIIAITVVYLFILFATWGVYHAFFLIDRRKRLVMEAKIEAMKPAPWNVHQVAVYEAAMGVYDGTCSQSRFRDVVEIAAAAREGGVTK